MPARQDLNTFCQKNWHRQDVAEIVASDNIGTPSSPWFEAVCYINDDEYSREYRSSKVGAKEAAAAVALQLLRDEYPGVYDEN